jgi:hypothetical protein
MPSVTFLSDMLPCYGDCHYAICCYAECRGTEAVVIVVLWFFKWLTGCFPDLTSSLNFHRKTINASFGRKASAPPAFTVKHMLIGKHRDTTKMYYLYGGDAEKLFYVMLNGSYTLAKVFWQKCLPFF